MFPRKHFLIPATLSLPLSNLERFLAAQNFSLSSDIVGFKFLIPTTGQLLIGIHKCQKARTPP
jgi:hypothetical protein